MQSKMQRHASTNHTMPRRAGGERHLSVLSLVNAGLISEADIAKQRAFTDEELRERMEALASYGIDGVIGC